MPTSNLIPNFNCFTHIMDCIPRTWNYMARLQEFKTKHRELTELGKQLETQKNTVNSKVKDAEKEGLVCNHDVIGWLQDVEARKIGLNEVLDEGSQLLQRSCLGACYPCGCWNSQNFLSKVTSEISLVKDLIGRGNFVTVSQNPAPPSVQRVPEGRNVGLESEFETAWSFIQEDDAGIMGLYGVGGVGKTALLTKMTNELLKRSCGFDVIVSVVISKDINVGRVRKQIRERLGLSMPESEDLSLLPTDIFNNLTTKRFLIMLDDIWEKVDLASVGIPHPKDPNSVHNKCKIVFTTRSSQVCGQMVTDKNVKVECLKMHQAMVLFADRLGVNKQCLLNPEIKKLGESIVKECAGLPLALIVTAGTMASQTTVGEWRYALNTLQNNAAEFSGMEEKVFSILKFSYDNLLDEAIKSCLLFCSLYPEDMDIDVDSLIQEWIGEGYIDGFEEWESAVDKGYYIIGVLRSTCLLEFSKNLGEKAVKMHDVIRDLAHWIAHECGAENDKFLVKIGEQVTQAPDTAKWEKAHAVSMMNTRITHLHHIPKCSNLSTFLFIYNNRLESIPDNFFLYMPTLRFLDLSFHTISYLKPHVIPTSMGELASLEYLNISSRGSKNELPVEMKKLVALKYMFLGEFIHVPLGVIKCLLNLRSLGLNISRFGNGEDDDMLAGTRELESLPELKHLQIEISNVEDLQVFLSRDRLVSCTWYLAIDIRKNDIKLFFSLASIPCLNLGCMEKLRRLRIGDDWRKIEELAIDNKASFNKLEFLILDRLPRLIVSWDRSNCVGPFFNNLHYANIKGCHRLVNLTWLSTAPVIQYLTVMDCKRLEGILIEEGSVTFDENTFSQLRQLWLRRLPSLQSICSNTLPFPFLEELNVDGCPDLKKLPLDPTKANKTLVIRGRSKWWNNLEWEGESAKSTFTSAFHATAPSSHIIPM